MVVRKVIAAFKYVSRCALEPAHTDSGDYYVQLFPTSRLSDIILVVSNGHGGRIYTTEISKHLFFSPRETTVRHLPFTLPFIIAIATAVTV